jgi:predicted DCC family thiol-disulfide oxidoreductase YuxK
MSQSPERISRVSQHTSQAILVYDDQCPLCLRFKQALMRWDIFHDITFVPLSDENFFRIQNSLTKEACQAQVHLLSEEGKIYKGPEVIDYLIRKVPAVSKLSWLLDTQASQKTLQFFYEQVNELREKMKEEKCGECPHEKKN